MIYLVAGLSLLLLTSSFYLFGFKPLSDRLRTEHAFLIEHFLESRLWLVQGVLNKHESLSGQAASRTAIREKQLAYQRGELSLDELVAFSAPKLSDAIQANGDIVGIARFDLMGRLLFNVGEQLPDGIAQRCGLAKLEAIRILNPEQIAGTRRLLYCSPIMDPVTGRIGADILIMRDSAIQEAIDAPSGEDAHLMIAGLTSGNRIDFWPSKYANAPERTVLNKFLASGVTEPGYIIRSKTVPADNWRLYSVVNKDRFYAGIKQQMKVLLAVIVGVALLVFIVTVAALRPIIRTLLREQQLLDISNHDGLTGLYNHAYMEESLQRELVRAWRYKRPLSILMLDIDHFKQVNDQYGHLIGNDVLCHFAKLVLRSARNQDIATRYGGDEFVLILTETGKEAAASVAERIRLEVAAMRVETEAGVIGVTTSVGVVSYDSNVGEVTVAQIIKVADEALYASKANGRNQVTVQDLPSEKPSI
ncbi:MAG TPA: GGDEF domain-containing protein [Thiobacillus sp.]